MRDSTKFKVEFTDNAGWECVGKINGVDYKLWIPNSAAARVFQVINSIYEAF